MEDKIKSGIIYCANYVCNGCPYNCIRHSATDRMNSSADGYVRCMQELMEDIYENIKAVENATNITHARWIKDTEMQRMNGHIYDYCCSNCHASAQKGIYNNYDKLTPYCPHCGAKMDEEKPKNE